MHPGGNIMCILSQTKIHQPLIDARAKKREKKFKNTKTVYSRRFSFNLTGEGGVFLN